MKAEHLLAAVGVVAAALLMLGLTDLGLIVDTNPRRQGPGQRFILGVLLEETQGQPCHRLVVEGSGDGNLGGPGRPMLACRYLTRYSATTRVCWSSPSNASGRDSCPFLVWL